jgi:ribonuclease P protein component
MGAIVQRLKTRRQFLRVAAGKRKWASPGIVLQVAPQPLHDRAVPEGPRYGLTVSRRVGNAVVRNRTRRRLRAAAEQVLPNCAVLTHDYVLIGRQGTPGRDFSALKRDLETGLRKLGAFRQAAEENRTA